MKENKLCHLPSPIQTLTFELSGEPWPRRRAMYLPLRDVPGIGLDPSLFPTESRWSLLLRRLRWILLTPVGGPKLFFHPRRVKTKFRKEVTTVESSTGTHAHAPS
jgi:hypothetical protein